MEPQFAQLAEAPAPSLPPFKGRGKVQFANFLTFFLILNNFLKDPLPSPVSNLDGGAMSSSMNSSKKKDNFLLTKNF